MTFNPDNNVYMVYVDVMTLSTIYGKSLSLQQGPRSRVSTNPEVVGSDLLQSGSVLSDQIPIESASAQVAR